MDESILAILSAASLIVPAIFGFVALRLGVRQAREFHEHTGETGVIMNVTALSLFRDDEQQCDAPKNDEASPELPLQMPARRARALATVD